MGGEERGIEGREGMGGGVTGCSRWKRRESEVRSAYLMIESVCLKVARPFHAAAATPPNQISKVSAFGQQPRRSISWTTCQALCQPWRQGIRERDIVGKSQARACFHHAIISCRLSIGNKYAAGSSSSHCPEAGEGRRPYK
jgi:hypothetical protein